jgi:pimeloyl-ACP methyl ester carboxylesterase
VNIVLVHGGWQGGWTWDEVAESLRTSGHTVVAPTLQGHEQGDLDRSDVTLTSIAADLVEQIDRLGMARYVLVAHSGGGPVAQLVAHARSGQVERVVFVNAWVLDPGQSIMDLLPPGKQSTLRSAAERTADGTVPIPRAMFASMVQHATPEQFESLVLRLVPTPLGWLTEPMPLPSPIPPMPTGYVILTEDASTPVSVFLDAAARLGRPTIVECTSGHQAMMTHPGELATAILAACA